MDYCVQLAFRTSTPQRSTATKSGPPLKVVEGLGCKPACVTDQEIACDRWQGQRLDGQFRVPVVVEVMLEKVTNIAMGTEIDNHQRIRGELPAPADAPNWPWPAGLT